LEAVVPAFRRFTEHPDNPARLGRHQVHDALAAELEAVVDLLEPIRSVVHEEYEPCWDQGQVGDCTANAALGCLVTAPFGRPGVSFTEQDALALYGLETRIDDSQIPGSYPPDDTGSSGPWSMMALEKQGRIRSWRHTRALHATLRMLNTGPVSIGVPWLRSMFQVDEQFTILVDPASGFAGGHQVCLVANDAEQRRVRVRNSWGTSWADVGHAWLRWDDLGWLLSEGGDAVQPVM
jgi:hypothetical protein